MKEAVVQFSEAKSVDEEVWNSFAQGLHYQKVDIGTSEDYTQLGALLERIDEERGTHGNRVFYLSTAPSLYAEAVKQLGQANLARPEGKGWVRVIIEKPFGTDLASAQALNRDIHQHLDESQIYRIDHYLGKETVQNLLVFRFANGIYEPLWNRQYIDHVRSRTPRRSASKGAAATTRRQASCATCCRTTSFRFSRSLRWRPRRASIPNPCATRRSRP
jgi:glucose-6-phosphate 1-dehydrogenase